MRRRLVHAVTWTLATGGAVLLAWFGVHTVMAGTAYDPPRTLPVSQSGGAPSSALPQASSTHRPKPPSSSASSPLSAPASRPGGTSSPGRGAHGGGSGSGGGGGNGRTSHSPSASESNSSPTQAGHVRGVGVTGGRAVFDMGQDSATLVSATPDSGWAMQVWKAPTWIRVTFSQGETSNSVFCRWDDGTPRIETYAD
jgi:hypothetical protein